MPKKTDGRKPKFRILCMKCHSYINTAFAFEHSTTAPFFRVEIVCTQCSNFANSFEEE